MPTLVVSKYSKKYQPRWSDYIFNYGCSKQWDFITVDDYLGKKHHNQQTVNKLKTFQQIGSWNHVSDVSFETNQVKIPEWTTDKNVALSWGVPFMARMTLTGHSGQGIVLYDGTETTCVSAPLYVKYIKKKHEYRVHVFNGSVIDVTQKKKRKDAEFVDTKIRNHANGWVYCREGVVASDKLLHCAINAIKALGLSFGAADIIYNALKDEYYLLEVNTAPGLVGTTLDKYAEAIIKEIKGN